MSMIIVKDQEKAQDAKHEQAVDSSESDVSLHPTRVKVKPKPEADQDQTRRKPKAPESQTRSIPYATHHLPIGDSDETT